MNAFNSINATSETLPRKSEKFSNMNVRNWSIGKKLASSFALVVVITISVNAVTWSTLSSIEQTADQTDHTHKVLAELNSAMAAMVDQETGLRGYLLSENDQGFLAPFQTGRDSYTRHFNEVRRLTSDNPAQQSRLADLDRSAQAWREGHANRAIAMMVHPEMRTQARHMELSGGGKASMDGLRAKLAEIAGEEQRLMSLRSTAQASAFEMGRVVNLVGGTLAVLSAAVLALVLARGIASPVRALTGCMGRIAGGDLRVEIPCQGRGDELGHMAKTVLNFRDSLEEAELLRAQQAEAEVLAGQEKRQATQQFANNVEQALGSVVQALSGAAAKLISSTQSLSDLADITQTQAGSAAAGATQASGNVQTVAAAAEELSASVSEISRQVAQSA
ncbi:CHASE3 domain-containing protein, partial [Belnapia sp. F-4-1]|uniref:CHASE3 domain-containing protein n=1 Tax=Belnapia sp. F-4-1 TaxID=1545443 RepID=UPI0011872C12